ncbi:hypothetical protein KY308_01820 [Candidatus Woesearchaeota archaeon]|nr:hypothetical protein [Candidatus Woesearchaeota archaeon]
MLVKKSQSWVEASFIALLVVGIVLSMFARNEVFSYIIISLCGVLFGRLIYEQRKNPKWGFYLIIAGFLLGYVIGNYYANTLVLVILFVVFIIISYIIHLKKLI